MRYLKRSGIRPVVIIITFFLFIYNIPIAGAQETGDVSDNNPEIISEAMALIYSPEPVFSSTPSEEIDPVYLADPGFDRIYPNIPYTFTARDGTDLFAFRYPVKDSDATVLLLHGVLSGAYMMNRTAGLLRESLNAEIIALDLRGHGMSGGKPGDVDYIDQYADDIADIISALKIGKPDGTIIVAGHSMGGGIALRFAMRDDMPGIDGYILFTPLLGYESPTLPSPSDAGTPDDTETFMKIHIPRIIGLKILNAAGEHAYDHLPVLFFNLPDGAPLHAYSYRANQSMTPEDYKAGLAAVDKPLIVLTGSDDEVFVAQAFETVVNTHSDGDVYVIPGATHNGIRHSPEVMRLIRNWALNHHLIRGFLETGY